MERMPTIKDIAIELGISISTVSRALRDLPDVNTTTKRAVMELAEKLEYQPNKAALHLLKKQTFNIGIIVPNLDYFMSTAIKGIDEIAMENGYTLIVCQSNESYERELVNTKRLLESGVDGFIVSISSNTKVTDHFKKIEVKGFPLVFFDRDIADVNVPKVVFDNVEAGYIATKHLIENGYSKIAFLGGPEKMKISNLRFEGYKAALEDAGLQCNPDFVEHGEFNQYSAFVNTEVLLNAKIKPDAIFTMSDRLALGAMESIKKRGLRMPKDIGLIGINNEPITSLLTPTLSTIDQPAHEMGKTATRIFIEMLKGNSFVNESTVMLKPKLIARESTLRKYMH